MSDPCLHGMPTPASCIDCMDAGNLERLAEDRPVPMGAAITARFDGDDARDVDIETGEIRNPINDKD